MWKRLPLSGRGKETQISRPVLIDTTYEGKNLVKISSISDFSSVSTGPDAPSSLGHSHHNNPTATAHFPQYPTLRPSGRNIYKPRISVAPTASSIYSDDFIPHDEVLPPVPPLIASRPSEISPPSSPEPIMDQRPVASRLEGTAPRARYKSNIPVNRSPTGAPAAQNRKDDLAGAGRLERTASSRIKNVFRSQRAESPVSPTAAGPNNASSTTPQDIPTEVYHSSSQDHKLGNRVSIRGGLDRWKRESKPQPSHNVLTLDERPPWKGASGRHAIVTPVQDKPLPPEKQAIVSQGFRKRVSSLRAAALEDASLSNHVRNVETPNRNEPDLETTYDQYAASPSISPEIGRSAASQSPRTPTAQGTTQPPYQFSVSPALPETPTPGQEHAMPFNDIEASNRSLLPNASSPAIGSQSSPGERGVTSRFSWSTHATGTTGANLSPPPTPPPPVPALVSSNTNFSMPGRKSASRGQDFSPASRTNVTKGGDAATARSKALPLSPPEQASGDLISSLEAQMDDLRHRRGNVQRLIRDLSNRQPKNPFYQDRVAREQANKKVRALEDELADITSQEHDTGLRLHRAWKRRDQDGEHTSLWIRRVTS